MSKNGGNGCGLLFIGLVLLLLGIGFLYQHEGGHLSTLTENKTPPVYVNQVTAGWDVGFVAHDVLLTYKGKPDLGDVDVTLSLFSEDGSKSEMKLYWTSWETGEVKRINVPAKKYPSLKLEGNAYHGLMIFALEWPFTWP